MDITLVRQGDYHTEKIDQKIVECISGGDISNLSKSTLRILYACGQRPLYVSNELSDDWQVNVEKSPQSVPTFIFCGKSTISQQSAGILKEQMEDVGFKIKKKAFNCLSEKAFPKTNVKRHYTTLIRCLAQSVSKKGGDHIIIVAKPKVLDSIYYAVTQEKSDWEEGCYVKSIRGSKENYTYNPNDPHYITEGLLDTMLIHSVNGPKCPNDLKRFSGKISYPKGSEYMLHTLKKGILEK